MPKCFKIYFAVAKATLHTCDSGVVGNARPCQGRDRGFEPRLSLYKSLRLYDLRFFHAMK